jgi:hypothetical protein
MAKDIEFVPSKELENELNERQGSKQGKQQQSLNLNKGEKGRSQTQGIGKNISGQERKKK